MSEVEGGPRPEEIEETPDEASQAEKDKTPEEIEAETAAMEKVMDIDTKGLGYTFVGDVTGSVSYKDSSESILEKVLRYGLLGAKDYGPKPTPQKWYENVRRDKMSHIFINIVGRASDLRDKKGNKFYPENTELSTSRQGLGSRFGIIIDLSSYREEDAVEQDSLNTDQKRRTYRAKMDDWDRRQGRSEPISDLGFMLSFRVPPRHFLGIVMPTRSRGNTPFSQEERQISFTRDPELIERVKTMMIKTCTGKEKLAVPIYDMHGNLMWPREMSYEQVKHFVAERETRKKKE